MINLNFFNIEEIIFLNQEIRNKFLDLKHIIDQWDMGYRFAGLDFIKKRAKLDMLNSLNEDHLKVLTEFLKDSIVIDRIDYNVIKNFKFPVETVPNLEDVNISNFCVTRNKDSFSLTFWR